MTTYNIASPSNAAATARLVSRIGRGSFLNLFELAMKFIGGKSQSYGSGDFLYTSLRFTRGLFGKYYSIYSY